MPAGDLRSLAPERRDLLVRTAAAEFAAAGYERASLNKIISECGMSKSSFYYVLDAKEDLFDLVLRDLTGRLGELLDIPAPGEFAGEGFWPRVEALFADFLAVAATDEAFSDLGRMFYLARTPDEVRGTVAATLGAVRSWLAEVLRVGRASGAVRADLPAELQVGLVFAVLQTFDVWAVRHTDTLTDDEQAGLFGAQLAAVRRLLAP